MSKTLQALRTKLTWQNNELHLQVQAAETETQVLHEQIKALQDKINQSCSATKLINPEVEISRMNFMMQQQQEKDDLLLTLKNHRQQEEALKNKVQRIKSELKMLEQYLLKQQQQQQHEHRKAAEHSLEEWVVQKKESA